MRAAIVLSLLAGCADSPPMAESRMELSSSSLGASDVGSVVVLVLGGAHASCERALAPASPLDDPELDVIRHALFTVDGTAKHLQIPAGEKLVFYVDAYRSPDGTLPHVGRGCAEATLAAGRSTGVAITLTADDGS